MWGYSWWQLVGASYVVVGLLGAAWWWHDMTSERGVRMLDRAMPPMPESWRTSTYWTMIVVGAVVVAVGWWWFVPSRLREAWQDRRCRCAECKAARKAGKP